MTVRMSEDEGKTWPVSRVLWPGPAAYSCLAVLPDGSLACLFEAGEKHPYERIVLARFDREWLDGGEQIEVEQDVAVRYDASEDNRRLMKGSNHYLAHSGQHCRRDHLRGAVHNEKEIIVCTSVEEKGDPMAGLVAVLVVLGILGLVAIIGIGIYNGLVGSRNQVDNAWAQIDVQLKRRHDLIPNLVETAKGYMKHERETFESITKARSAGHGRQDRVRDRQERKASSPTL